MESTQTLRPDPKHFRRQKIQFGLFVLLFVFWCILTYYNRIWNTPITLLFFSLLLMHLIYLIDHNSKKIILTEDALSYRSLLKNRDIKVSEIAAYQWWDIPLFRADSGHSAQFHLNIFNVINQHLESFVIIPTKASGKRKLKCFKSGKLAIWLEENFTEIHSNEDA